MATAKQVKMRKQVLEFIEQFPEYHGQTEYICGTQACIAGTAILIDRTDNQVQLIAGRFARGLADTLLTDAEWETLDGFYQGRKLLGLSFEEAEGLFYDEDEASAIEKLRWLAAEEPADR